MKIKCEENICFRVSICDFSTPAQTCQDLQVDQSDIDVVS